MDGLLLCESCGHGAAIHPASGCGFRCRCRETTERMVLNWMPDVAVTSREWPAR